MAKKKAKTGRTRRTPKKPPPAGAPAPADWAPAFLAALSATANVRRSCQAAGVGRATAYERREADAAFAASWQAALDDAVDDLELEARRRAHHGLLRVKFHQGLPIMVPLAGPDGRPVVGEGGAPVLTPYVEHEYSDTLMIFLLKAHRPEKYRDNVKVEHGGHVRHTVSAEDLTDEELAAIARRAAETE